MLLCLSFQATVSPLPRLFNASEATVPLCQLQISCAGEDGAQCPEHVLANADFYVRLLYPRAAPYSRGEYVALGRPACVDKLKIRLATLSEKIDVPTLNETYELRLDGSELTIEAENSFGVARGLATLVQLSDVLAGLEEDLHTYSIQDKVVIQDWPQFPWREVLLDGARHYIPLETLRRHVDGLSLAKFNVLHLHGVDAESFAYRLDGALGEALYKGAYGPQFYYSVQDLVELQEYCFQRGVILYMEVDVPGHAFSWRHADVKNVANCSEWTNHENGVPLNPAYPPVYDYVGEVVKQLTSSQLFRDRKTTPMIHLGGDEMNASCWLEDPSVAQYLSDNNLTTAQLWREFHKKVHDLISEANKGMTRPWQVYWDDAFVNGNFFDPENAIVHYWRSLDKTAAINKGLRTIQSIHWYLDKMHPYSGARYAYADTWKDFYKVSLYENLTTAEQKRLVIGGGACQWGEWVWDASIERHMYPRILAISEVLWTYPDSREPTEAVAARFDALSCALRRAGIQSGPLQPGAPCLGELQ